MGVKTKSETAERQLLFPVMQSGRIGYIDRQGRMVVSPQFSGVEEDSFRVVGAIAVRGFREDLLPCR